MSDFFKGIISLTEFPWDNAENILVRSSVRNFNIVIDTFSEKDENGELVDEYKLDGELDDLDSEYLKSILEDYRIMLSKEYDYLTGKEAIVETILANDYEFSEKGEF